MYYNPQTQEMLSDQELKNLLNISFPKTTESIEGWLYIHEALPEPETGKMPVKDSIEVKDGQAIQTYKMEDVPSEEEEESASENLDSIPDRIASLEMKFDSIKGAFYSKESRQIPSEDISKKIKMLEDCIEELAATISNLQVYCINAIEEMKKASKK